MFWFAQKRLSLRRSMSQRAAHEFIRSNLVFAEEKTAQIRKTQENFLSCQIRARPNLCDNQISPK